MQPALGMVLQQTTAPMTLNKATDDYASQSVQDTLEQLQVDPAVGLTDQEVKTRQARFGYNEISEREEPLWHRIFRRFWGPIPWMIEVAATLSAIVGKWEDFVIILIMLLVNAFLDFFQEHRALNALKALKAQMAREVAVLRQGSVKTIAVRELVPGDIVKLKIGDIVPADIQLLEGDYLLIDESSLTGESLPVTKKVDKIGYANTIVKQGEMWAVVINTGSATTFQGVVSLVARAQLEERSHFQKMVIQIGNFLILITVALVVLIVIVALFRHESLMEIARFAMVLTVAAIPVALPAVLSVTMAVGAVNLARHKAIVSRLTAIEEMAGVDVLCADKTGTLTKNEMQVAIPVVLDGHSERELFLLAAAASRPENRDPIELPIFAYIDTHFPDLDWQSCRQQHFIPFDPIRKRTEAVIDRQGEHFVAMKGAAQVLLEMTDLPEQKMSAISAQVGQLAAKGYRTLAVGRKQGDEPLTLLGLIPLYDPPREDSLQVIEEMRKNGVRIKMITGDNVAIAREVGQLLGLEQRAMRSSQFFGAAGSELLSLVEILTMAFYQKLKPEISHRAAEEFAADVMNTVQQLYDTRLLEREFVHTREAAIVELIETVEIFAEVVPEDKYRIVDTLQKGGHIVGMTGDGVNDAPALKKADCGIAVENATDAARAAADIILTAPGLGVINEAVKQARITFERMKSYATFRIAETIRIILFMTLSIVVFNFYPITALMIILLTLLNDIPILAIAYDHTRVDRRPVRWLMSNLLTIASILGIAGVVSSFTLFFILQELGYQQDVIQSLLFLKLLVAGHSTLYITRTDGWFWQRPFPSPLLFTATFATEIAGTLIAVYGIYVTPISWQLAGWIWLYALLWFLFNDTVKMGANRLLRRNHS